MSELGRRRGRRQGDVVALAEVREQTATTDEAPPLAVGGRFSLAELRRGELPPTLAVPAAGEMLGLTRSHSYELVKQGAFPAKVIRCGGRVRVITSSVLQVLGVGEA